MRKPAEPAAIPLMSLIGTVNAIKNSVWKGRDGGRAQSG